MTQSDQIRAIVVDQAEPGRLVVRPARLAPAAPGDPVMDARKDDVDAFVYAQVRREDLRESVQGWCTHRHSRDAGWS